MAAWRTLAALGFLLALGSVSQAGASQTEPIYQIQADDAEMNAAKAHGIASLPEFYARLAHPGADEREFMVKFDIVPGDRVEYVWATNLDRSTSPMTGVLVNQPEETADRIGTRVPIPEADIIDWSYRRGRVTQGNFTTRVLLQHMPPNEAAAIRNYLGW